MIGLHPARIGKSRAAVHQHRIVDRRAVDIARLQHPGAVIFRHQFVAVMQEDAARGWPRHIVQTSQRIVAQRGRPAALPHRDQPVLYIVEIGLDPVRGQIAIVVIAVLMMITSYDF